MTFRLVGLMSVVLLLSLAAFALLMTYVQDQVMDEVARTASEVGRATLRTLEVQGDWDPSFVVDRIESEGPGEVVVFSRTGNAPMVWQSGTDETGRVVRKQTRELRTEVLIETDDEGDPRTAVGYGFTVIRLDDVEAVRSAEDDVVLHIPTVQAHDHDFNEFVVSDDAPPGEFRFEVPTSTYQELFAGMRRKSLWVFLGVFLLGTALSSGLATRFTRPVRRLDAAIRRLSEGDLETRVAVAGGDEVGRLGEAFNEMAARLKEGRERAREMTRREKLSALGRLAAGVAHDVRNPLHSIGLTLQHLRDECRPDDDDGRAGEFDRSLDLIRDEIRRLDKRVGNFLQFARSERRQREMTSLAELVAETVHLIEKEAERRGVRVETVGLDADTRVEVDAEAVRAALLNLVLNAFEAMPDGGTLRLALSRSDGEVRLEVDDDGQGIPEEDRERVFEFAYTTRDGGSGLGLAMVHQVVVEDHGGRVALDSRPGEGTRVSLSFPADEARG